MAFLTALIRFQACHPGVKALYSDCGTNFVGAEKIIQNAVENSATVGGTTPSLMAPIEWRFLPPHAPHRGGSWERLIRSTKRILTSVLGKGDVSYEIFRTVLIQAALIMNSRPLTPESADVTDALPLTPMDFLHPGVTLNTDPTLMKFNPGEPDRLRYVHEKVIHFVRSFWKRWSKEYVTTLKNRSKWSKDAPKPTVGQLVILVDELRIRKQWKLGRIIKKRL